MQNEKSPLLSLPEALRIRVVIHPCTRTHEANFRTIATPPNIYHSTPSSPPSPPLYLPTPVISQVVVAAAARIVVAISGCRITLSPIPTPSRAIPVWPHPAAGQAGGVTTRHYSVLLVRACVCARVLPLSSALCSHGRTRKSD